MQGELVCLDVEATGLDVESDAIIEVAAVRFDSNGIIAEFDTLIDPGVPIPSRIVSLTGITDADVTGKPRMRAIADDLMAFIGDAPIVGHKIEMDLGYLQPYGIGVDNIRIDTYELAAFLIPTAARYSLSNLVEELALDDLQAHRAMGDTKATVQLFWTLWDKLMALPLNVLREIVDAAIDLKWDAKPPLVEALRQRSQTALSERISNRATLPFKPSLRRDWEVLRANERSVKLDVDTLSAQIEPNGKLAEYIPGYESRGPQVDMLRRVAEAFNAGEHVMIEAPTGTGKSIAYLIPSIYWALLNKRRVMVSTATIALQDQIMFKDIPLLQEALGEDLIAAVAKGRSNYLCPRQLNALRRRRPTSIDELRILAKVLVWLIKSDSGDKADINLRGFAEEMAWFKISAQDEGCALSRCEQQMSGACPFYKARRKAEAAHVVVANHALLLSDVQMGNRVLPDYEYLVLDEAHHLEEATTRGLQTRLDRITLRRRFADLGDDKRGMFGELLSELRGNIPQKSYEQIEPFVIDVSDAVKKMGHHFDMYFSVLMDFLAETGQIGSGEYSTSVRITEAERETLGWQKLAKVMENLQEFFDVLSSAMEKIARTLGKLSEYDIPNYEDLMNTLQASARHFMEIEQQLVAFTIEPEKNMIYWCEISATGNYVSVNAARLHVGPLIDKHLWSAKESVILTSATLRTANSFNFVRERLDATEDMVDEFDVPSPFDYQSSTLIYIPDDIPEPNMRQQYQNMLERGIITAATATEGRLLGLFTSYAQLRQTAQNIAPRLALGGIQVYDQGSGSSRQLLVESFKSSEKAVLLGTRSFWEGIDLPGEDLQVLAIARLPFSVPSDPIFAARSETFENSFMQYGVPDAILRFRQGFGRLIRRKSDRGVVIIFDKRTISKRYGRLFLDSLPTCTIKRGRLNGIGNAVREWLDL